MVNDIVSFYGHEISLLLAVKEFPYPLNLDITCPFVFSGYLAHEDSL